jgi:23S rRNA pseudouridine2605 synthase
MSRRAAEEEIQNGNFTINGIVATLGDKVAPTKDEVMYKGRRIYKKHSDNYVYIMLNKPVGYVTTLSDEKGRPCITDLMEGLSTRVYPIGRLDMYSEGLLLLTNDGAMTEKLTHPRHNIPKVYRVRVDSMITEEQYKKLLSPMVLDGYEIEPVYCEVLKREENRTILQMTLYEGRNRQIRRMCEQVGLHILGLKRISIGDIRLGTLRPGQWKYLNHDQIQYLKSI